MHPPDDASILILGDLTEAQQRAVMHVDGPLLVLAGPGSGKTTVVTRRVAYLIQLGVPAWQILGLTFTNKAAGEMRERIDALVPQDVAGRRGLTITTFHAFCARLLRRYAPVLGLNDQYTIYDGTDQRDAVKQAIRTAGLTTKNWTPSAVLHAISNAKNTLQTASEYTANASDFYERSIARAFTAYEGILSANDALDFDDLLLNVATLLRDHAEARAELQDRFRYIMIDEYQDTNHAQFIIAHALAAEHGNIVVVGDPDQSIYGWRGADIRNILDFEQQYPTATTVPLGQNFRSTGAIVRGAAALIENNQHRKAKRIYTELDEGETIRIVTCQDERHEASLIAEQFERLHRELHVPYREMAVLYRINALSRVLEDAFRSRRLPYVIARGTAFYERREVKDALAYLRVLANPNDDVALRRIINTPTRGIGRTTLDRVEIYSIHHQISLRDALLRADQVPQLSARAMKSIAAFNTMFETWRQLASDTAEDGFMGAVDMTSLAELVETVIRESGLESMYGSSRAEEDRERVENLEELISAAAEFTPESSEDDLDGRRSSTTFGALVAFLESITLVTDADVIDPLRGAVTLMTLHAAKGLEFDTVAIAGLEEGLLPHTRAAGDEAELEEERRLCFVGMTRAKRRLQLSRAAVRTQRGMRDRTIESQFLRELPDDVLDVHDHAGVNAACRAFGVDGDPSFGLDGPHLDPYDDGTMLEIGTMVRHPTFGVGEVRSVTRKTVGSTARINFETVGERTLILEYVRLEKA